MTHRDRYYKRSLCNQTPYKDKPGVFQEAADFFAALIFTLVLSGIFSSLLISGLEALR